MTSRTQAINRKCKECLYDPYAPGTWREQVAACVSSNCHLYPVRPVSKGCRVNGAICPVAVAAVRAKLEV